MAYRLVAPEDASLHGFNKSIAAWLRANGYENAGVGQFPSESAAWHYIQDAEARSTRQPIFRVVAASTVEGVALRGSSES